MSKTKQKTAVCPDCKTEYRLQRGSTGDQEGKTFAASFCITSGCDHEFDWSDMGKSVDKNTE